MRLSDDRIAGCDGRGEVASADAVESERKVVRPKDDDGADGSKAGANIFFEVEGGVVPGLFAHCGSGLTELVRGAGKLDVFEARRHGKGCLFGSGCDDRWCGGFDVGGVGVKEGGDLRWVDGAKFRAAAFVAAVRARSTSDQRLVGKARGRTSAFAGFSAWKVPSASAVRHLPSINT